MKRRIIINTTVLTLAFVTFNPLMYKAEEVSDPFVKVNIEKVQSGDEIVETDINSSSNISGMLISKKDGKSFLDKFRKDKTSSDSNGIKNKKSDDEKIQTIENKENDSIKSDLENLNNDIETDSANKNMITEEKITLPTLEEAIKSVSQESQTNGKVIEGRVETLNDLHLSDCIKAALENNPSIMSAIANKEIYKTKIGQAWSNYFPEFSLGTGYTRTKVLMPALSSFKMDPYNNYNTVSATASQLVYDFGKTRAQANIAKKTYESTEQSLQGIINSTIYNVKSAYYNLLYAIQQEQVLKDSVEIYKMHLNQAKAYYDIGTKPKIDVITAERNLSNVRLSHIKAKNLIDIAYADLNNAMGLPEKTNYRVSDKLDSAYYDVDFNKEILRAYELRPELLAAEKKAEASKYLVKASKVAFLPDLKVAASYNLGGRDMTQDYGYTFGGAFEYPVTNLMLLKKQVDEAKATSKKDNADLEVQKQKVYLEVKQAYISLIEAQESVPVAKMALIQAKEQYELANGRYKVGLGDTIEFKDAENTYRTSQLDYYKTLLDYNTAAANLERVIGAPLTVSETPLL